MWQSSVEKKAELFSRIPEMGFVHNPKKHEENGREGVKKEEGKGKGEGEGGRTEVLNVMWERRRPQKQREIRDGF